jgi:hypothetical protein
MARIPESDYQELLRLTEAAKPKRAAYFAVKNRLTIPDVNDASLAAARQAKRVLEEIFITNGFSLIDAIVSERGYGPISDSDTHFRGRALESVLNGSFNGLSEPDYRYGDLKLIETRRDHVLTQVLTIGAIFAATDKSTGDYVIEQDYLKSKFYTKVRQAIIVAYRKQSKQLGIRVEQVIVFEVDNPLWARELQADWESIRDEMIKSINEFRAGKRARRASGICKSDTSGKRRPNGYLGIRSDGVVFTARFYELMARHYAENN